MALDLASILPGAAAVPDASPGFGRVGSAVGSGWPGLDGALRVGGAGGLARGAVHEWIGVCDGEGGPRTGGDAPWSPPVLLMAHLAERAVADAATRGTARAVVWIGRAVWPYPRVLAGGYGVLEVLHPTAGRAVDGGERSLALELALHERAEAFSAGAASSAGDGGSTSDGGSGAGPSELFARSLFVDVDGRDAAEDPRARRRRRGAPRPGRKLWAIDTALRCPGVTAVVADGSGLDMAASRRLQLAAARSGALVLLARPPAERGEISAATTRWRVTREESPEIADGDEGFAPTARGVRWRAELLRAKGAQVLVEADERTSSGFRRHTSAPQAPAHHDPGSPVTGPAHAAGPMPREAFQRGGTAPDLHERSPCGAPSASTSPTSPSTSPSAAGPARRADPARCPPPASS